MSGEVAYALAFDLQNSLAYFDADKVLIPTDARADEPTKVDIHRRFVRVFAAERAFVRRVWSTVAPLLEGPDQVVVLFDIDQTLGSRKGRPGEAATLVRPSAALLMAQLEAAGVLMGILTTRGISDLRANLEDALHLKRIAPYLDARHLTAAEMSEHSSYAATAPASEMPADALAPLASVLAPAYASVAALQAWRDERGRPLPPKDLDKLAQLRHVRDGHPDTMFVVVDDRDYAALLAGPAARVVGVHLAEDERAHY